MDEKTKRELMARYKASSSIYNQRYSEIQTAKYRFIDSIISIKDFPLILDLGGGTGLLRSYLPDQIKLIIVDYSLEMIQQASSSKNTQVNSVLILADVEQLPF